MGARQLLGDIKRRPIPLQRGIGAQDDFLNLAGPNALHQSIECKLFRSNSVEWRDPASQDMIDALISARFFQSDNIAWLLDHTNDCRVAPLVAADLAFLRFSQIITPFA